MRHLLSFPDEATMHAVLQPIPQSPYGAAIMRGAMGVAGAYVDSGRVDADGSAIWTETRAPVVWPGYHVELAIDGDLPEELAPYASPHAA